MQSHKVFKWKGNVGGWFNKKKSDFNTEDFQFNYHFFEPWLSFSHRDQDAHHCNHDNEGALELKSWPKSTFCASQTLLTLIKQGQCVIL